jgi:hypothetical protein
VRCGRESKFNGHLLARAGTPRSARRGESRSRYRIQLSDRTREEPTAVRHCGEQVTGGLAELFQVRRRHANLHCRNACCPLDQAGMKVQVKLPRPLGSALPADGVRLARTSPLCRTSILHCKVVLLYGVQRSRAHVVPSASRNNGCFSTSCYDSRSLKARLK